MNLTFDNQALRGRGWEGDALYLGGNGNPVLGKLYLHSSSFTFRKPTDKQGWPSLSGDLPASVGAIAVAEGSVTLKSTSGTYRFELFPSSVRSLREWVDQKKEAMAVVSRLGTSFLGSYEAYPHPFTEAHTAPGEDKHRLFRYLGECIPALQEPLQWGLRDIFLEIDEEMTELRLDNWKYYEVDNVIRIDCQDAAFGFFDDSGYEFEFHFEIRYLGAGKLSKYRWEAEKRMPDLKFKAATYAPNSTGNYVVEDPFGLTGYYKITWSVRSD